MSDSEINEAVALAIEPEPPSFHKDKDWTKGYEESQYGLSIGAAGIYVTEHGAWLLSGDERRDSPTIEEMSGLTDSLEGQRTADEIRATRES